MIDRRFVSQLRHPTKGGSLPRSRATVAQDPPGIDAIRYLQPHETFSAVAPAGGAQVEGRLGKSGLWDAEPQLRMPAFDPTGGHSIARSTRTLAAMVHARFPIWKRILDLSLVLLTSWIWLPTMIFVACLIKIVSPGPVIYRQSRIGFRGKAFKILKFRSMRVNAETERHEDYLENLMRNNSPMTKLDENDSRLITFGRYLRATGIDELPQIFNVLRGDMTLVGPRPCTDREYECYLPWQKARVNAPPGLTGYWQVNGKNKTTFNQMMRMDLYYARRMSLALDLRILCKTFPAVLQQTWESCLKKCFADNGGTGINGVSASSLGRSSKSI